MLAGAAGLLLHNVPLMLTALFAMGVHSSFFGPIKYAILPQHLHKDEVLGGTGLVEAGTYGRSEEHTSELQSLMRISYAVFCLKKKKNKKRTQIKTISRQQEI